MLYAVCARCGPPGHKSHALSALAHACSSRYSLQLFVYCVGVGIFVFLSFFFLLLLGIEETCARIIHPGRRDECDTNRSNFTRREFSRFPSLNRSLVRVSTSFLFWDRIRKIINANRQWRVRRCKMDDCILISWSIRTVPWWWVAAALIRAGWRVRTASRRAASATLHPVDGCILTDFGLVVPFF